MKQLAQRYPTVYLAQQQCHVGTAPTLVNTVLGSCVGITIADPVTQVGGVAHAFLPRWVHGDRPGGGPCKYVDAAFEKLLAEMLGAGASWENLVVKLFGGAQMMHSKTPDVPQDAKHIGARNIAAAQRYAQEAGLTLAAQDVGGPVGRKLLFLTHTGQVWIKKL